MRSSSAFAHYVSLTSRLPHLDLSTALPDDAHKIAFFVNLYNAATQHAVTSCGPPPANALLRLWFGVRVGYAVGGYALSLHDMENGILRNNRSVSILPPPFSKNDPRRVLCVRKPDPRIHFVLNCAASSCPPVLYLTPSKLEHVLAMAARGFLADVNNFDVVDRCVYLSQIFKWYLQDFSADGSERGMLYFIVANGDLKQPSIRRLEEMLRRITGEIPIFWRRYDWSLNGVS